MQEDVPQALQPMEFKASKNGGPFATRTKLGWVINGPLGRTTLKSPTANFVQANKTLEQQFQEYCNLAERPQGSGYHGTNCQARKRPLRNRAALENVPPESSTQQSSCRTPIRFTDETTKERTNGT